MLYTKEYKLCCMQVKTRSMCVKRSSRAIPSCVCLPAFSYGLARSCWFVRVIVAGKETDIVIRSACDVSTVQTHYGSCIFRTETDTRTNKHHSLRTHVAKYLVPPVSFYVKAPLPRLLPLLCLTSKLLFGVCILNYTQKNTLVCRPEALGEFQCIFFFK